MPQRATPGKGLRVPLVFLGVSILLVILFGAVGSAPLVVLWAIAVWMWVMYKSGD